MNIDVIENTIIQACLKHLGAWFGKAIFPRLKRGKPGEPDLLVTLPTQPLTMLAIECKTRLATRAQALHAALQVQEYAGKKATAVLFTEWIPEPVAEELRKNGIGFVDVTGNAYLYNPPQVLIDVRGKRPETPLKAEPGRIVEAGGLKVCHLLLTNPQTLNQPLRAIAELAGVSLGTAHVVMRELMAANWVLPGENNMRRFADPKDLIDVFVRGYTLKLRPDCLIGRFRHKGTSPIEVVGAFKRRLAAAHGAWALTGGMAARELTKHLEPDTIAVFVEEQLAEQLKGEPMLPDPNGNVVLLGLFAKTAIDHERRVAPPLATPLLIYAELLQDGRPREVETAKMIYEGFVLPTLEGERRGT